MPVPQLPEWAVALGADPSRYQAFLRRRGQSGQSPGYGNDMRAMPLPGGDRSDMVARPVPPDATRPGRRLGQQADRPGRRMSDSEMQRGLDSGDLPVRDAVAQLDARRAGPAAAAIENANPNVRFLRPNEPTQGGIGPGVTPPPVLPPATMPMFGIGPQPTFAQIPGFAGEPLPYGNDTVVRPVPPAGLLDNPLLNGNPDAIAQLLRARMAMGAA